MHRTARVICLLALVVSNTAFAQVSQATQATSAPLYSGGDGSSRKTAVVIGAGNESEGVRAEYTWMHDNLPGAKLESTSLDSGESVYDINVVRLPSGETRTVYFDISAFFGKP